MPLPLVVPALTTAGRFLGQIGLKRLSTNLLTKAGTMSSSMATTTASRGLFARAKDFFIPKSTLGKVGVGGLTAYSLMPSDSENAQNDDKMSLWGTAFKAAGIGGIANAVMGGSFFKGALTTGTLALGAVWAWNDLQSNPSTIKGLAEKVLPSETYKSIFGDSNNLKENANPNAQDTQDVKSVQEKAEQEQAHKKHSEELNKQLIEKDKEIATLKEQNATLQAEKKDLANSNDNVNMAYAVWGDKIMTNEEKMKVIGEALKQMNETERAEFFKKIKNDCDTAKDNFEATNKDLQAKESHLTNVEKVKGMGQDDREIQQSYKDVENAKESVNKATESTQKAEEQVVQKDSLYSQLLGDYGNINKQSQEKLNEVEENINNNMKGANSDDNAAINSLNNEAAAKSSNEAETNTPPANTNTQGETNKIAKQGGPR